MSNRQPTEESFLKDVEKHKMTVLLDNGIYRHLHFASTGEHSCNQWFDIVTWPGRLAYTGDMGTYIFARLEDMFKFFRTHPDRDKEKLHINLSYWGEKLEAVDRSGRELGFRIFSSEILKEHVEEQIKTWVEECNIPFESTEEEEVAARSKFEAEIREIIKEDVYRYFNDGEFEARRVIGEFGCDIDGDHYEFNDTWEWDCEEYTYHFMWCCYSLAWSIQQYDKLKAETK